MLLLCWPFCAYLRCCRCYVFPLILSLIRVLSCSYQALELEQSEDEDIVAGALRVLRRIIGDELVEVCER